MTDQQKYNDKTAQASLIIAASHDASFVRTHPNADGRAGVPVMLPTLALLAMIDRAAPDMMRAYLRERSDLIDGPGEPLTVNGANMTAEEYLDAVPEADSPEDMDEQPDILDDDELITTPTGRLLLVQRIAHLYPKDSPAEHLVVADWIIADEHEGEQIEDRTLCGDAL